MRTRVLFFSEKDKGNENLETSDCKTANEGCPRRECQEE